MTDFRTSDRDVNRAIRSWLREDRHEDASRVAGAVLDQAETTPQRRTTWWPARRTPLVNKFLAMGLGAAAVVVALFVGVQLFSSPDGGTGGQSSSTATVEPTPEPTPSPSAATELDEGPFVLSGQSDVTVTIPAPGWYADDGIPVKNENGQPPDGAYVFGPWTGASAAYIPADPCQWQSTMPDTQATTLDEIVAALASQTSRNASEPVDITVDGYSGKSITLHVPDDIAFASGGFSDCDENQFCTFGDATGCQMWNAQGPGAIDELWIVDVDGEIFLVTGAYYAQTPAEDVAELQAILGSMTFGE